MCHRLSDIFTPWYEAMQTRNRDDSDGDDRARSPPPLDIDLADPDIEEVDLSRSHLDEPQL